MTAAARWITASCLSLAAAFEPCGIAGAQTRKLNGPLVFSYVDDAYGYTLTPSGRIVYAARVLGLTQLHSVPLDGNGPTVLLQENTLALADVVDLVPTPDGARVVYRLDRDLSTVMELFSVRVDGSQPALKLHAPLAAGESVESFQLAPDGQRAVYMKRVTEVDGGVTTFHHRLYSVPVDGSQGPVLLSNILEAWNPRITSDSKRVVFMGNHDFGAFWLYSVPIAGGGKAPRRLNPHMTRTRSVSDFVLSPDGARVVYRADQETEDVTELFSVPADGSAAPVKLSGLLPAGGDVGHGYQVSPDSTRVAYWADQLLDNVHAIFAVPMSGGTPLQLTPNGELGAIAFSPDGANVVYACVRPGDSSNRLYSVPADGSHVRIEMSGPIVAGGNVSAGFKIAADSSRVVYLADATTDAVNELYSVPLDGSAAPVRLNPALAAQPAGHRVETDFRLTGTGRVLFRMNTGPVVSFDLYSVPHTGSAPAVRINSTLPDGSFFVGYGSVTDFLVDAASGQVLYRADQFAFGLQELFSAPLDGSAASVVRSDLRQHIRVDGDVYGYAVGVDGRKAVYHATEDAGDDLYAVSLRGPLERRRLDAALDFGLTGDWKLLVTPDSSRVVYRPADDGQEEPYRVIQLRSVPLDASEAPVTLSPIPISGDVFEFACTPDSDRVVFRYQRDSDAVGLLCSVPANGSAAPVELTPAGTVDDGVTTFRITPDSQLVVFLGAETPTVTELFAVQVSGLSAPVQLSAEVVAGGDVAEFALSPDGSHVVYLADQDLNDVLELFSVPVAGGAVPVELSTIDASTKDVIAFQISPDGSRVVYRADQDVNDVFELYSVSIDGSTGPVELSAITGTTKDVGTFLISPDSSRVVYLADQVTAGVLELFTAPITGGQAPVKLNQTPVAGGDVTGLFRIGAGRVVYVADQDANELFELYSAPLTGGSTAVKISAPLGLDRDVIDLQLDPDGRWVLYNADSDTNDVYELHAVPIDGSRPVLRINAPLQSTGPRLISGAFLPDRASVLFLADQDDAGANELYVDDELLLSPARPHLRQR
jgi:Tol biopolymer transport system component